MRTAGLVLGLCACLFWMSGCGGPLWAPVIPPTAGLFTGIKAPLSTQFNEKTQVATKKGESSTMSILWLVAIGDGSIDAAARSGNLSTIHYADYSFLSVLGGLFAQYTTILYGD